MDLLAQLPATLEGACVLLEVRLLCTLGSRHGCSQASRWEIQMEACWPFCLRLYKDQCACSQEQVLALNMGLLGVQ